MGSFFVHGSGSQILADGLLIFFVQRRGKCMTVNGWSFERESASYEPLPSKYMQIKRQPEFDERVKKLSEYLPEAQRRFFIEKVYPFTYYFHDGQFRKSGEPYIIHPIAVAEILAKYHVDCDTLCAGLMHDTYEDNAERVSLDEIARYFGPEIRLLVDGMTKIGIVTSQNRRQTAALRKEISESGYSTITNQKVYRSLVGQENNSGWEFSPGIDEQVKAKRIKIANKNASLAKLLLGIAEDPRIILIKLADRLHNLRTLGSLRPDKQKRIARETLEFFCPIADRFGVWEIKKELEELCFRYLYDNIYDIFRKKVEDVRQERRPILEATVKQIREVFSRETVQADIQIDDSGFYTVFKRMESSGVTSLEEVNGLSSVMITVPDKDACYNAESIIKRNFHLCGTRLYFDYISTPKANKYQAIHLAIRGCGRRVIKIRINSTEHRITNNIGVFAEFKDFDYCLEGRNVGLALRSKWASWVSSIRALHDVAAENTDFLDWALSGSLAHSITCFTPRGDSVDLPVGSTPLDFAFAIRDELGLTCEGALVNDRSVSCLEYKLKDNDFVTIISSNDVIPQRSWFDYCCTPKARSALSTWYQENYKLDSNRAYGEKLLAAALLRANLPGMQKNKEFMRILTRKCSCQSVADLLDMIGTRRISLKFVNAQFEECKLGCETEDKANSVVNSYEVSAWVHIPGISDGKVYICQECCPIVGDEIVAIGSNSEHLTLHRKECTKAESSKQELANQSLVEEKAFWLEKAQPVGASTDFRAKIELKAIYNYALAIETIVRCHDSEHKIYDLQLQNNFIGNAAHIIVTVGVSNIAELGSLMENLRKIDDVAEVRRL